MTEQQPKPEVTRFEFFSTIGIVYLWIGLTILSQTLNEWYRFPIFCLSFLMFFMYTGKASFSWLRRPEP